MERLSEAGISFWKKSDKNKMYLLIIYVCIFKITVSTSICSGGNCGGSEWKAFFLEISWRQERIVDTGTAWNWILPSSP
jgi:hypothetical protein